MAFVAGNKYQRAPQRHAFDFTEQIDIDRHTVEYGADNPADDSRKYIEREFFGKTPMDHYLRPFGHRPDRFDCRIFYRPPQSPNRPIGQP